VRYIKSRSNQGDVLIFPLLDPVMFTSNLLLLLLPALTFASPTRTLVTRANSTSARPSVPTISPSDAVAYPFTVPISDGAARTDQDFVDGE